MRLRPVFHMQNQVIANRLNALSRSDPVRLLVFLVGFVVVAAGWAAAAERIVLPFDEGWRFFGGEAQGAAAIAFDASKWRQLDVPHDWSIEGPFSAANPTGAGGAFLPAGVGWYRKHFSLPSTLANRRIFIEFDGIMANSDVWINGTHLGRRPNGYVSFGYELTRHLVIGDNGTNVLAVRADNSGQPASRWYSGAGIYRHVRLVAVNSVHLQKWSSFITTPEITAKQATVRVRSKIVNQSAKSCEAVLQITIASPTGRSEATVKSKPRIIAAGKTVEFQEDLLVSNPMLWQLDRPLLYHARLSVRSGSANTDDETVTFGIRNAGFAAETGFWLNGKNVKIKGVCLHHDGGAFGAAVPLCVWERRLEQLRLLGVNAIRTAHNPPAPEFLSLCDRMGFLVMDELFDCWTIGKTPFDYHRHFNDWSHIDVRDTVLRDRNHPSIILYSAGNEIRDTTNADLAKRILAGLVGVFHRYDPTRPVTQGLFRPNVSHDYDNGLADLLDVVGTNYRDMELLEAWKSKPQRKIIGTEQRHDLATWLAARDHPQHAGQFLWSGIDYLGESTRWPLIAADFGLLDRTGAIKPMAQERRSWWSETPVVQIVRGQAKLADWTPTDAGSHEETVEAYSNCEEVELNLNGKSLGSKPRNADDSPRVWKVAWEPGTLKAIGRNRGALVAEHELRTAGEPVKISLSVDREKLMPSWDDVAFVTATITDQDGIPVSASSDTISFSITGPGVIAAVDNADNASIEPFQASSRRVYQGRCYAMIKAKAARGAITVAASAPSLAGASVAINK